MYYKRNCSVGIREKSGDKTQIFSFGAGRGLDESTLRGWADRVMRKLDDGESATDVKEWVKSQLRE